MIILLSYYLSVADLFKTCIHPSHIPCNQTKRFDKVSELTEYHPSSDISALIVDEDVVLCVQSSVEESEAGVVSVFPSFIDVIWHRNVNFVVASVVVSLVSVRIVLF